MTARAYDPWGGHPIATNDNRPQPSMVERVARALACVDGHGDFLPGSEAKGWHEPARAAIEAMRCLPEGTAARLRLDETHVAAYRDIIDAALAEHDKRRAA